VGLQQRLVCTEPQPLKQLERIVAVWSICHDARLKQTSAGCTALLAICAQFRSPLTASICLKVASPSLNPSLQQQQQQEQQQQHPQAVSIIGNM
jgi:hypothetical protein